MTGDRTTDPSIHTACASPADFDAMAAVVAATVSMAERLGSEAAALLLRRALASIQDRSLRPGESRHRSLHPDDPRLFTPP